jgi:hypothetical protein
MVFTVMRLCCVLVIIQQYFGGTCTFRVEGWRLKVEGFTTILVSTNQITTWCCNLEDHNMTLYCHEYFKSYTIINSFFLHLKENSCHKFCTELLVQQYCNLVLSYRYSKCNYSSWHLKCIGSNKFWGKCLRHLMIDTQFYCIISEKQFHFLLYAQVWLN